MNLKLLDAIYVSSKKIYNHLFPIYKYLHVDGRYQHDSSKISIEFICKIDNFTAYIIEYL